MFLKKRSWVHGYAGVFQVSVGLASPLLAVMKSSKQSGFKCCSHSARFGNLSNSLFHGSCVLKKPPLPCVVASSMVFCKIPWQFDDEAISLHFWCGFPSCGADSGAKINLYTWEFQDPKSPNGDVRLLNGVVFTNLAIYGAPLRNLPKRLRMDLWEGAARKSGTRVSLVTATWKSWMI